MSRPAWVIGILAGVGLLAGGGYMLLRHRGSPPAEMQAAAFEHFEAAELVEADEMTWQPTADLVGTAVAMRSVMLRNELSGVVRHVGFESGDIVEAGHVLIRQDETTDKADLEAVRASVRVAEANIAQADSEIRLAEAELQRLRSAGERAVAAVELDRANARLDTATADRGKWIAEADQARARVAQMEARIAKLTIVAPFKARVGMRSVHEGQYLAEGADIVALQEVSDTIYLDFAIPQKYTAYVSPGTTVMAYADLLGDEPVQIKIVAADATVNNQTRNLRVRSIVDNTRGLLVPGMFVQVRVPIEQPRTYVVVPSVAVRRAAYANSVFVIAPDEHGVTRAKQRYVTLGQTVGESVIVLEGLEPGDSIAAAGSFKLRDGVKVVPGPPGGDPSTGGAPAQETAQASNR